MRGGIAQKTQKNRRGAESLEVFLIKHRREGENVDACLKRMLLENHPDKTRGGPVATAVDSGAPIREVLEARRIWRLGRSAPGTESCRAEKTTGAGGADACMCRPPFSAGFPPWPADFRGAPAGYWPHPSSQGGRDPRCCPSTSQRCRYATYESGPPRREGAWGASTAREESYSFGKEGATGAHEVPLIFDGGLRKEEVTNNAAPPQTFFHARASRASSPRRATTAGRQESDGDGPPLGEVAAGPGCVRGAAWLACAFYAVLCLLLNASAWAKSLVAPLALQG
jgi:hypothetical protein